MRTDLRVVSQALSKSVPVKLASTLDAYLENRFQRNFMNGVLNLIAFIALLVVGTGYLISGWTLSGGLLLGLGVLSLLLGIWDIWIYRRNLPPVANKTHSSRPTTKELPAPRTELTPPEALRNRLRESLAQASEPKDGGARDLRRRYC